jgi:hypothetical protein
MGTDLGVVSNVDRAEQSGADAEHHPVTDDRMTLAGLGIGPPAARAERHLVVHRDVVPDPGGLTDDDAGAMVNEQPAADPGSGVDLDAGEHSGHKGQSARNQGQSPPVQPMGNPVRPHRPYAGIEQHLEYADAVQCRIAAARRPHIIEHGEFPRLRAD